MFPGLCHLSHGVIVGCGRKSPPESIKILVMSRWMRELFDWDKYVSAVKVTGLLVVITLHPVAAEMQKTHEPVRNFSFTFQFSPQLVWWKLMNEFTTFCSGTRHKQKLLLRLLIN